MPDYANRAEREARLARALSRMGKRELDALFQIMGDPPRIENVTSEYWGELFTQWTSVLTPELESIFVESAINMLADTQLGGIGVDWDLVNDGASRWARQYGSQLVRGIDERTRAGVNRAIGDFYEQGLNMQQLREKLNRWYGPVRAEMFATTEVTRAASQGELEIVKELQGEGVVMTAFWLTSNGELVCPICRPLNGRAADGGTPDRPTWTHPDTGAVYEAPPAHPRCRCGLRHELRNNANDNS